MRENGLFFPVMMVFMVLLYINFTSVFLEIQRFKNHLYELFENLKVGFSHFKKIVLFASERPLKLMKNDFNFTLKALFVFKIFKCLSWLFGQVEKMVRLEREG